MSGRQFVAAYTNPSGRILAISEPSYSVVAAQRDVERLSSPEDQTEVFVASRFLPDWERYDTSPYPANVSCACGALIHADMPYVETEADGVLWHGNPEGGGHRADVEL